MLLRKLLPRILIILGAVNEALSRGHGRGHSSSHGSSGHSSSSTSGHSSSSTSGHSSSSTSGHSSSYSNHISSISAHSGTHRNKWSSSPSSDEYKTSDRVASATPEPPAFDTMSFKAPFHGYDFEEKPAYRKPVDYISPVISVNELDNFLSGYFTGKSFNSALSSSNHLVNEPYQVPIIMPTSRRETEKEEGDIWKKGKDLKSDSNTIKAPSNNNLPFFAIHCLELYNALKDMKDIAESVDEICQPFRRVTKIPAAVSTTTTTITTTEAPLLTTLPYVKPPKRKHQVRILPTTQPGINCQKVMNSELTEEGEIIDTVWEVCDPPPTTTTTTRRPTTKATTKRPTTTSKPLVRVCRPVMDSYLNDLGEIIDSVTEVCMMEPVNKNGLQF